MMDSQLVVQLPLIWVDTYVLKLWLRFVNDCNGTSTLPGTGGPGQALFN